MKKLLLLSLLVLFGCSKEASEPEIPRYTLTVTANPSEGGLVNPQTGTYNSGQTVNIVASANDFFAFSNWTGNWNGTENSFTITMDSNKTITGNFDKIDLDEDGILNDRDNCPNTSVGSDVDNGGCSLGQLDTDGDGITNDIDLCPSQGGDVDSNGCPDSDGDGIPNNIDQCNQYLNYDIAEVDSNGCKINFVDFQLINNNNSYYSDFTIRAADNAQIGQMDIICTSGCGQYGNTHSITNGAFSGEKIFKVVDKEELIMIVDNGEDPGFIPVTSKIQNFYGVFKQKQITPFVYEIIRYMDVSNATNFNEMFYRSGFDFGQVNGYSDTYIGNSNNSFYQKDAFKYWDTENITDMNWMFMSADFAELNLSLWDTSNVVSMERMFANYGLLYRPWDQTIERERGTTSTMNESTPSDCVQCGPTYDRSKLRLFSDVSNVENFNGMFSRYWGIYSANNEWGLQSWDTSSATDMSLMFFESRLIGVEQWNVSSVTNCDNFALRAEVGTGIRNFLSYKFKRYVDTENFTIPNYYSNGEDEVFTFEYINSRPGYTIIIDPLPNFTNCNTD
jgi:hypothetical protein